jgi:hypothetical protein
MSTWMSIGPDPNQMDLTTEPYAEPSISEAGDDALPRPTGGLDQAAPGEFGAVSGPRGSRTHWIARAIKPLIARHPPLHVPGWRLR